MKKVLFLILSFICIVTIARAEAVCQIISGNGYGIGDEINCGGEHFYILENDGTNIKALTKYNLYVGTNYYENRTEEIETDKILQNELAIGAHDGVSGEPDSTQIGVTRFYTLYANFRNFGTPYGNGGYIDGELNSESTDATKVIGYLNGYKQSLNNMNLTISNIDLITVSEINNLVKKITNKSLPLEEWYEHFDENSTNLGGDTYVYRIGSIKEKIPKEYEWIYSTTYWTRTISQIDNANYIYFIDTLGDLCNAYECQVAVGAGIRPVITFSASELEYKIETKTDGNGTVKSEKVRAKGGEVIKFTATPNKGYELNVIKVTDDKNNVVTFKDYSFTMPNANVLIEATFVKVEAIENPDTGAYISVGLLITVLLITSVFYKKNIFKKFKKV